MRIEEYEKLNEETHESRLKSLMEGGTGIPLTTEMARLLLELEKEVKRLSDIRENKT